MTTLHDRHPTVADGNRLRAALARAALLGERHPGPGSAGPDSGPPPAADPGARAERALRRWREQAPFHDGDWFLRRLDADGLTPQRLRDLLAEPAQRLADRIDLGRRGANDWADRLASCYERWAVHQRPAQPWSGPEEHAFAALTTPLLADGRARLHRRATELADRFGTAPGQPADLVRQFYPTLVAGMAGMVSRPLVLELNIARVTGTLAGDTPQDRFRSFVERLSDPAVAVAVLGEYPVLARQLMTALDNWVHTSAVLLERLHRDWAAVTVAFAGGTSPGPVTAIDTGLGDRHRGGASVARITFASGLRVMYKPRSLAVDEHFQQLLDWLNPRLSLPLRRLVCLDRRGYGWMEHVVARPCADNASLGRFYQRAGALLALLYVLDGTDCHAENLIAVGEDPVMVDLESLLQPRFTDAFDDVPESERMARHLAAGSVLRSGLLPARFWDGPADGGVDLSALGRAPRQMSPRAVAVLAGAGTDAMRLEYEQTPLDPTDNWPVLADAPLLPQDYLDDLDRGFVEVYRLFASRRAELAGLLRQFAGDEVRLLRRDTAEYSSLLASSFHPDLLRDGLARERHFDRLWNLAARDSTAQAFLAPERADLWANDIPVFTTRPDSTDAYTSTGARIAGVVPRTALDIVLEKLDTLSEPDLVRQRWLYHSAVTATAVELAGDTTLPVYPYRSPADTRPERIAARALETAAVVADRLAALAFRGPGDATWIGPNATLSGSWVVAPLGPDLYSGLGGIALFTAQLAARTGDAEHRALAAAVRTTFAHQLTRGDLGGGGLGGFGGALYVLAHLAALADGPVRDDLVRLGQRLVPTVTALVADDRHYDVLAGAAGSLGGLLAWHAVEPSGPVRDAIRHHADHLAAAARPQQTGVGWLPAGMTAVSGRPLASFAHGNAGIAAALVAAAHLLGERRHRDIATDAMRYERTLFDPAAGNWADIRTDPAAPEPAESEARDHGPKFLVAWCHGATGVGFGRAAGLAVEASARGDAATDRDAVADLDAALRVVAADGFGSNFSLCHGDMGSLDLLLYGQPFASTPDEVAATAHSRAAGVMDGIDRHGFICGMPRGAESPALMVGLAGTGYGLLRVAAPAEVPSVLALEPPSA